MDAKIFKTAAHIDPAYAEELKRAVIKGVEVIAYDVYIDYEKISLNQKITSII
jgi:DNA-binding sugar fermentation-stimulating protein